MTAIAGVKSLPEPQSELSDEELVKRIGGADDQAFSILLERHLNMVHGLAMRMLGSNADAQDLAQDVFLKIWRAPEKYEPGQAKFTTWLARVASNACIDRLRRPRTQPLEAAGDPADSRPGPYDNAFDAGRSRVVEQAISALPERQKLALNLCYFQRFSNMEAAGIMEVSIEAMESLLARARRKLKQDLSNDIDKLLD